MIEILRKRRSIRKYTGQPVSRQARDLLVETLLRSPTSRNGKSWEFVVVDDAHLLESLESQTTGGCFSEGRGPWDCYRRPNNRGVLF
jgi:nitroreductase